ncbi:universal stress protein [Kaustia mangrovi]|uniref:Universal stress protein n=1 Tax=Kaustia mangrovi TaxID=2593653 RepID=A0A7S8C2V8_9HYPH|nr:universal stress protein [Kaustia mangrovi]QPC42350.1 universal stress protein [Kaustia mangrovi]
MFQTIVVAVDGSDHSYKAVDTAVDLAKHYGSSLVMTSVYRHHSMLESTHSLVRGREEIEPPDATLKRLAREFTDEAVKRAKDAGIDSVTSEVKRGHPARTIVEIAQQHKADAIVMGSRGLGDIGALLLGSVSHKVNSIAPCTCITVR